MDFLTLEQFGDGTEGSPSWGFASLEQGWTPQHPLDVAPGDMEALAVPGKDGTRCPTLIPWNSSPWNILQYM